MMSIGTVGYHWIEGWSWSESFYMTVITISTVGYGEIHPLSEQGRLFSVVLILVSFGSIAYCATLFFGFILEGGIANFIKRLKMEQSIRNLREHYIICGIGRKGKAVCRHFQSYDMSFVVVEKDPDMIRFADETGYLFIHGDAHDDHVLKNAGILHARGLVAILGQDAENVFLVLSARQMNPRLQVVAWASSYESERKLKRAGADRVLSPFELGGFQVVQSLIRPHVMDFLNSALNIENEELQLEQVRISRDSVVAGKTLQECRLNPSVKVLGIIRGEEQHYQISGQDTFQEDDILIVLGARNNLTQFIETM